VLIDRPAELFCSAEDAWFWYWQCQIARDEGARFVAGAGVVGRPCDPDDVCCAALSLLRRGVLQRGHLSTLASYGRAMTPPDPRVPDQANAHRLWEEALDRMTTVLRAKGIVE
jgi:hypothetical protein